MNHSPLASQRHETESAEEEVTHPGVVCDACHMGPIHGTRYKCEQCPNYDLCPGCYALEDDRPSDPTQQPGPPPGGNGDQGGHQPHVHSFEALEQPRTVTLGEVWLAMACNSPLSVEEKNLLLDGAALQLWREAKAFYSLEQQYDRAANLARQALRTYSGLGKIDGVMKSLGLLAPICQRQGFAHLGLRHGKQAYALALDHGTERDKVIALSSLASMYQPAGLTIPDHIEARLDELLANPAIAPDLRYQVGKNKLYNRVTGALSRGEVREAQEHIRRLNEFNLGAPDGPRKVETEAEIHLQLGNCWNLLGHNRQALDEYQQAEALARAGALEDLLPEVRFHMGTLYIALGDYPRGTELCLEYLAQCRDPLHQAKVFLNMGTAMFQRGEYRQALDLFIQAQQLVRWVRDREKAAVARTASSSALFMAPGDDESPARHQKPPEEEEEEEGEEAQGEKAHNYELAKLWVDIVNNMGLVYYAMGEYRFALLQFRACTLFYKDDRSKVISRTNESNCHLSMSEYAEAIAVGEECRRLAERIGFTEGIHGALHNLAGVYSATGEYRRATETYERALDMARAQDDRPAVLKAQQALATNYLMQLQLQAAKTLFEDSLCLARELEDSACLAAGHLGIAQAGYLDAGSRHDPEARVEYHLREAIALRETCRGQLWDIFKVWFMTSNRLAYDMLINILVEEGRTDEALLIAEQMKARALYDHLHQHQHQHHSGDDAEGSVAVVVGPPGGGVATGPQAGQPSISQSPLSIAGGWKDEKELVLAAQGLADGLGAIITVYHITTDLVVDGLRPGTLESASKSTRLYAWALFPRGSVTAMAATDEGEKEKEEEERAAEGGSLLHFRQVDLGAFCEEAQIASFEDLFPRMRRTMGVRGRNTDIEEDSDSDNAEPAHSDESLLAKLHRLLFSPEWAPFLERVDTLLLVPHMELFGAPLYAAVDGRGRHLVQTHALGVALSLRTLQLSWHKAATAAAADDAEPRKVLIVGDPSPMPAVPEKGLVGVRRQLNPLPHAREEATAVSRCFSRAATVSSSLLTGSQASKVAVVQAMATAHVIHLATHGLLDDYTLSGYHGALALAADEDQKKDGADDDAMPFHLVPDGILCSSEIMAMRLVRAELVVLSACNTGQGQITADGVVGLARAFLASGVLCTLVSLWTVDDSSTAEHMRAFYGHLAERVDPVRAFRQATLQLRERYQDDPAKWAAFLPVGLPLVLPIQHYMTPPSESA